MLLYGRRTYILFPDAHWSPEADIAGIVNENFVYLDLRRRIGHPSKIALETPAFATLGNGEIDFYVKTIKGHKSYAIEVKAGKRTAKRYRPY